MNIEKSVVFLYTSSEQLGNKIKKRQFKTGLKKEHYKFKDKFNKNVQVLSIENNKILWREIKGDLNKQSFSLFMDQQSQY